MQTNSRRNHLSVGIARKLTYIPLLKAYNGFTSPASFSVVVRAVGPIRSDEVSVEERDFLRSAFA